MCAPTTEKPSQGVFVPNVELPPLCSSKFKPGPPSDQAQVSTKVIADIIENSSCIDVKDLCVAKEHLVWCLYADIVCLDHDGAIIDACLLATIAALRTGMILCLLIFMLSNYWFLVSLPTVEYDHELNTKTVKDKERKPLKVYNCPISTTFAVFDEYVSNFV